MTLVTEELYTLEGPKKRTYNTADLPTYHLALRYFSNRNILGNFEQEKLAEALKQRMRPLVHQAILQAQYHDLPTPVATTLQTLVATNTLWILWGELDLHTRQEHEWRVNSYRYAPRPTTITHITHNDMGDLVIIPYSSTETQANRAIFNLRLQSRLGRLATSKRIQRVCDDYELTQAVINNPELFPELQQLCKGPLHHFLHYERATIIDKESQHQEGLLTLWQAAHTYKALRFARFTTYARKALHNKYCNLLTYARADCRRVNTFSIPIGSGANEEDSPLASDVADITHKLWREEQRDQTWQEGNNDYNPFDEKHDIFHAGVSDTSYDPFATRTLLEHREFKARRKDLRARTDEEEIHAYTEGTRKAYNFNGIPYFLDDGEIITDENFPHLGEKEIVTITELERMRAAYVKEHGEVLSFEDGLVDEIPF